MRRFLTVFFMLLMSIAVFGANDGVKEDKFEEMDQSLDNFDTETDDEAMDSLREKIKKKKEESSKEEDKSVVIEDSSKNLKKEDSNYNSKNSNSDKVAYNSNSSNSYSDDGDYSEEYKKTSLQMLSFGGGYDGVDYHGSKHVGLEYGLYMIPEEGNFLSGFTVGLGVVDLDDNYENSDYLSISYSAFIMPFGFTNAPFFRFDLGVLGANWVPDEDDDDDYYDEEDDDDSNFKDVGVLFKAGGGFLFGSSNFSMSLQILYTMHITTAGNNDGVELQLGFHF